MKGVRHNVYQIYPGGRTVLKTVDPQHVPVQEDIEEVERMLNDGYMVYADREMMEREWGGTAKPQTDPVGVLFDKVTSPTIAENMLWLAQRGSLGVSNDSWRDSGLWWVNFRLSTPDKIHEFSSLGGLGDVLDCTVEWVKEFVEEE